MFHLFESNSWGKPQDRRESGVGWNVKLSLPVILATKWGHARPVLVTSLGQSYPRLAMTEYSRVVGWNCAMVVMREKRWAVQRAGPP